MISYNLVTTPIYETWSKNSFNLLAGEWCRIYGDRKIINQYNYEISEYHWDDRKKYYKDSKYLREINLKVFIHLTDELNKYHKVNYPMRFWKILIGPWLHKFTHIIFDKYETLKKNTKKYNIENSFILNLNSENFVPFDTKIFTHLMRDDLWHHYIFSKIIKNFFDIKCNFLDFKNKFEPDQRFKKEKNKINTKSNLLKKYVYFSNKIFDATDHEYFIKNTYLSLRDEIKLNFNLNKSLNLNLVSEENNFEIKKLNRQNFLADLQKLDDIFLKVLVFMVRDQLPKIYLENFKDFDNSLEQTKWPLKPKKIFTANAYEFDEYFKFYTAKKVIDGAKLIIGQHGGFFGMGKWNLPEEHQIDVADYFLSWGWKSQSSKIKDGFIFTNLNNTILKKNKNNKILFISSAIERYSCKTQAWPAGASQSYKFMESHINFFKNLNENIKKKFVFRVLKGADDLFRTGYINRMKDNFKNIIIDTGTTPLNKILSNFKMACITYNGGTLIQTLSMNFPTILYWDKDTFELNENSLKYFDELRLARIFHSNYKSASDHINSISENIDSWWESNEVQNARKNFCNNFAKIKIKKNHELLKLIKNI